VVAKAFLLEGNGTTGREAGCGNDIDDDGVPLSVQVSGWSQLASIGSVSVDMARPLQRLRSSG
jgi:hypothetical protein